jgi:hypothetical protein
MADNKAFWRRVVMMLLAPLMLVVGLFGFTVFFLIVACCTPYLMLSGWWSERQFRRRMLEQGRLMQIPDFEARMAAGEGTVLEEWGPKGPLRVWWTAEDLCSQVPALSERDLMHALFSTKECDGYEPRRNFNRTCLEIYIGGAKGKASLVVVSGWYAKVRRFVDRYRPSKRVVVIPPLGWWRENRAG